MNLLLIRPDELDADGRVRVRGRRARHIVQVLGKGVGDTVRAGVLGGRMGSASIEVADGQGLGLRVQLDEDPPPKRPLDLVLALPRPPVLRRLLQQVTAMGVRKIVLLHTARVEKSYWQSPALRPEAIAEQIELGLEQAVDTVPPVLEQARRFKPFVQDQVPSWVGSDTLLVADPSGAAPCPSDALSRVVLAVGPEGGFVPFELDLWREAGARVVCLGPRILRVETAVIALLGRLGA